MLLSQPCFLLYTSLSGEGKAVLSKSPYLSVRYNTSPGKEVKHWCKSREASYYLLADFLRVYYIFIHEWMRGIVHGVIRSNRGEP